MDKNRLVKLCEKILKINYKELEILELHAIPKYKFDYSSNDWIPDTFAIFITMCKSHSDSDDTNKEKKIISGGQIQNFLEGVLGLECSVDLIRIIKIPQS